MSFIAKNPLSVPEIEHTPSTPPGTRGLFAKEDGWYEVDDQGHVKKIGDSSGEEGVGRIGEGKNSIVFNDYENNKSIGDFSAASGSNTIAGIKGYYFSDINFTGEGTSWDKPVITLTKEQGVAPTTPFTVEYEVGDVISLVNGTKYYNCSQIIEVSNNRIIVDSLPFNSVTWDNGLDDNSVYVIKKPTIGYCNLGSYSHAEGDRTQALEISSHSEGRETVAYGQYSHTEGRGTQAGYSCHAEGYKTHAMGFYSHAEGSNSKTTGLYAHAENRMTKANGEASHAEGTSTRANGLCAHSEGKQTFANGDYSHSEGELTYAASNHQHVQGKFNEKKKKNKYAHIVGNGESNTKRSNAHTLDWDGNAWYAGSVEVGRNTIDEDSELVLVTKGYLKSFVNGVKEELKTNLKQEILNELLNELNGDEVEY